MFTTKGFTLIEILVVIAVIGLLAAIALITITGVQQEALNAQRKSDINQIRTAILRYYADNGQWPAYTTSASNGAGNDWPQSFKNELAPYMPSVPKDPVLNDQPADKYYWAGCETNPPNAAQCGNWYVVGVHLSGGDPDWGKMDPCGWGPEHWELLIGRC